MVERAGAAFCRVFDSEMKGKKQTQIVPEEDGKKVGKTKKSREFQLVSDCKPYETSS
jgi:hypothetical protein